MKTKGITITALLIGLFFYLSAQEKNIQPDANGVYKEVEVMPEFPGGLNAMQTYIMHEIKYPEQAKKDTITGKVLVQFVVDEHGKVTDSKVLRGANSLLDAEAIRVVAGMPDWTPGKQKGKAVKVYFTLPITFALK